MRSRDPSGVARGNEPMKCRVHSAVWCVAGSILILACAPAAPPPVAPAAAPTPLSVVSTAAPVLSNRVMLPRTQRRTAWTISAITRLTVSGSALPKGISDEQRIDTRALVSMSFDRMISGALRGSGQVDSFTIRSSIAESSAPRSVTAATSIRPSSSLLIDALSDSTILRVVSRPPLANECDRPEVSAMQLARELMVRIPDGVVEGSQWRDSTVTLVCRNGVPLTVYTTTRSTLTTMSRETLIVTRELRTALEGKGGAAFRAFEVAGTGSGSQRLEIAALTGILEKLSGTSTLALQVVERIPPGSPRSQQVLQQVEIRAERRR